MNTSSYSYFTIKTMEKQRNFFLHEKKKPPPDLYLVDTQGSGF